MGLDTPGGLGRGRAGFTWAVALAISGAIAACAGGGGPASTGVPAAASASSPGATPAASKSGFGIFQPGDPVPADIVGLWRDSIDDWVWFLPPGDPYCSNVVHTTQGCHVFWNDATVKGKPIPWTDVVTAVDGKLRFWSLGDQTCHGQASTVSYTLAGDKVDLRLEPGSCFTEVFDLIRPGTNGQPDAAAAPTLPVP